MLQVLMLGPSRYRGDAGVALWGGFMFLGGDWIIGYSLRLSWLSAQFAPPFPLPSLRSPGGWLLGFSGSGLRSRPRPRMDLASLLRSQSRPQAPSRVRLGAPSGRRLLRVRGVSMCPLAPVHIPPWIFGPAGSAPIRSRRCSSSLS
ncbi:hypothetical protein NDU88_005636 [Pleurodeles waltl]|uniref:Uncharacterized protein n=1 Tax=Pleurodeles waltl TaxID=8319 RepID=A0AAV7UK34_PLEWA|nr:hypothetical protein NDU88_005636 [Pleurodeles waltl]